MAETNKLPDFDEQYLEECHNNFLSSIRNNPNNFSFWFPKIENCGIPVPKSVIIQLPDDIIQSLFLEREGDDDRITDFVRNTVKPAIPEEWNRIFIKNGCFSNKFDFQYCCIRPTVHRLVTSIEQINMDALCLDTDGESELVIREFLEPYHYDDDELGIKIYSIYNGMPLRPEIRVFYDFDNRRALYAANYWDWNYCHDRICERDCTDELAYEAAYPTIESFFNKMQGNALELVEKSLKNVDMQGIWSVDLMWHEGQFWLIDMAVGHRSAYWDPKLAK